MDEALRLFRTLLSLSCFREARIVLLFTKLDLFMKKIKRKPLSGLFPEYTGQDGDPSAALKFITHEFLSCSPDYNTTIEVVYLDTTNTAQVLSFLEDLEEKITEDLRHTAGVQYNTPVISDFGKPIQCQKWRERWLSTEPNPPLKANVQWARNHHRSGAPRRAYRIGSMVTMHRAHTRPIP